MVKRHTLILMFLLVFAVSASAETLSRLSIPEPKWESIRQSIRQLPTDKLAHFAAGYMLQDLTYNLLFTKRVEYTTELGVRLTRKEGRRYGNLLSLTLSTTVWIMKEKFMDTSPDWSDVGASVLGSGVWLIRKQF
jgi:hypothetical protein